MLPVAPENLAAPRIKGTDEVGSLLSMHCSFTAPSDVREFRCVYVCVCVFMYVCAQGDTQKNAFVRTHCIKPDDSRRYYFGALREAPYRCEVYALSLCVRMELGNLHVPDVLHMKVI